MTRFVVVPQWQGSSSSRALQLLDGAAALAAELPSSARTDVDVPFEAGEALGTGILRWGSLRQTAARHRDALALVDERSLTVGGDSGVAVTAALVAAERDPGCAVLWLSAHGSLHPPGNGEGAAYDAVAVRALVDPTIPAAVESRIDPARVLVAGARAIDAVDSDVALSWDVAVQPTVEAGGIRAWLEALHPTSLFVHVDLDVFDPSVIAGVADAVPFGPDLATVTSAISSAREVVPLSGAALTEFSPASPSKAEDDLGTLLRLVAALA